MSSFFRRIAEKQRAHVDALALMRLVNQTAQDIAAADRDGRVADLLKCATASAPASIRIVFRADGSLRAEFALGPTAYGEPFEFANGHATPLARLVFLTFVSAWREAAAAFARSPKLGP